MASTYDPLGIICPCQVLEKVICNKICDEKIPGDAEAPENLKRKFVKWVRDTSTSVALNKESITEADLHVFDDASVFASCAVVYAVVHKISMRNQGLVVSKSCISKKSLTTPRLELVLAHMASNLIQNVKSVLKRFNVRSVTWWTDSTVILHWLNRQRL